MKFACLLVVAIAFISTTRAENMDATAHHEKEVSARLQAGDYCIDPNMAGTLFKLSVENSGVAFGSTIPGSGIPSLAGLLIGGSYDGYNFVCHQPYRQDSTIREQTCYSWSDSAVVSGLVSASQWYQSVDAPYRQIDQYVGAPTTSKIRFISCP